MPRRGRRARKGFIILFGTRGMIRSESSPALEAACPSCGRPTTLRGKSIRQWFTLFFIPVFPISGAERFTECDACHAQFRLSVDELRQRLVADEGRLRQQAITLYNSLRASPANSITLNELMIAYASMKEYDEAISAARQFPDALNNSEQCMTTLARVCLARDARQEAIAWFDAAITRNPGLGEAHYYKAIAHATAEPPQIDQAIAAARQARNVGYPDAESLVQDLEARARQTAGAAR